MCLDCGMLCWRCDCWCWVCVWFCFFCGCLCVVLVWCLWRRRVRRVSRDVSRTSLCVMWLMGRFLCVLMWLLLVWWWVCWVCCLCCLCCWCCCLDVWSRARRRFFSDTLSTSAFRTLILIDLFFVFFLLFLVWLNCLCYFFDWLLCMFLWWWVWCFWSRVASSRFRLRVFCIRDVCCLMCLWIFVIEIVCGENDVMWNNVVYVCIVCVVCVMCCWWCILYFNFNILSVFLSFVCVVCFIVFVMCFCVVCVCDVWCGFCFVFLCCWMCVNCCDVCVVCCKVFCVDVKMFVILCFVFVLLLLFLNMIEMCLVGMGYCVKVWFVFWWCMWMFLCCVCVWEVWDGRMMFWWWCVVMVWWWWCMLMLICGIDLIVLVCMSSLCVGVCCGWFEMWWWCSARARAWASILASSRWRRILDCVVVMFCLFGCYFEFLVGVILMGIMCLSVMVCEGVMGCWRCALVTRISWRSGSARRFGRSLFIYCWGRVCWRLCVCGVERFEDGSIWCVLCVWVKRKSCIGLLSCARNSRGEAFLILKFFCLCFVLMWVCVKWVCMYKIWRFVFKSVCLVVEWLSIFFCWKSWVNCLARRFWIFIRRYTTFSGW